MLSSFKIIRGVVSEPQNTISLDLRYRFPSLNKIDENGKRNDGWEKAMEEKMNRTRAAAEEIIRRAKEDAERIITEAQEEARNTIVELTKKAQEEGEKRGYHKGYQDGLEKAAIEGQAIREEASNVLRQAKELWVKTVEDMENDIVMLAREIAEKILATQLTLDPSVVLAIVKETLELARGKKQVILYVNPENVAFVEKKKSELLQALSVQTTLYIVGDSAVELGGCRIETEDSAIEATLAQRWESICKVLGVQ